MSDNEMNEMEYLRATFFSSDADFAAAAHQQAPSPKKARRSRKATEEIQALRMIVKGFEMLMKGGDNQIIAALNYLEDRYGKFARKRRTW